MNTILAYSVLLAVLISHTTDAKLTPPTFTCYFCTMVKGVSKDESCADPFSGKVTKTCNGSSCSKMKTVSNGNLAMSRGCWPKDEDTCYTKEGHGDSKVTVCACMGNYCNAAMTLYMTSFTTWLLGFFSVVITC
ncbi:hypothetical protein LSAT2_028107 [Lamellibrachia satsuma]|nr:hypothetical protein LSAT2_028107 [Lamellibrachia satsuma]